MNHNAIKLMLCLFVAIPTISAQDFVKTGSHKLPLPQNCGFFYDGVQVLDWESHEAVALLYRETRTICIYDLIKKNLLKCLQYDAEGPNGVGYEVAGFWIESPEEIYLYSYWEFSIFKVNSSGEVKAKWKLPVDAINIPIIELGTSTPLLKLGDEIVMSGSIFSLEGKPVKAPFVNLNVNNGSIRCSGVTPENMLENYYGQGSILHYAYAEDKNYFIVEFGASNSVYLMRGATTFERLAKSKYIDQILPLCTIPCRKKITTEMSIRQYAAGGYLGVRYDCYNQCYYRFVALPGEVSAIERGEMLHQSVILLDLNLNVKGEYELPYGSITELAFVTKEGLMIPNITSYQNENDNYLYFDVYNFSK